MKSIQRYVKYSSRAVFKGLVMFLGFMQVFAERICISYARYAPLQDGYFHVRVTWRISNIFKIGKNETFSTKIETNL